MDYNELTDLDLDWIKTASLDDLRDTLKFANQTQDVPYARALAREITRRTNAVKEPPTEG